MDYGNYTNNKYWAIVDTLRQNINKKAAAKPVILFIQFLIWVSLICCALPADSQHKNTSGIQPDPYGRYFQKDGKPFFFIGYYEWAPPVTGQTIGNNLTLKGLIDLTDQYNLNFVRISLGLNRIDENYVPFRYVNGKFDLDQWEPGYWDARDGLKHYVKYAKSKGINVLISIFDGVDIRGGNASWRYAGSFWNLKNQMKDFYGQIDTDNSGNADEPGEFYQTSDFVNRTGIGFYQKKLIDKAINEVASYDNVFFEVCNECMGGNAEWNYEVIKYIRSKTHKVIVLNLNSFNRYINNDPDNEQGYSVHFVERKLKDNSLLVKEWVASHVGSEPVWYDPDGSELKQGHADENRRAAWYSLVGGAAGYGGFQMDIRNGGPNTAKLRYYQNLMNFLSTTGVPFWTMTPKHVLISNNSENSLLSSPGKYYLAYIRHDDSVSVNLTLGSYKYKIYNPQTGNYSKVQTITNWDGGDKMFSKPSGEDWVIYVYKNKN